MKADLIDEIIDWRVAMNAMLYCLNLHKRPGETCGKLKRSVADRIRLGRLNQLKPAMKVRLQAGI